MDRSITSGLKNTASVPEPFVSTAAGTYVQLVLNLVLYLDSDSGSDSASGAQLSQSSDLKR